MAKVFVQARQFLSACNRIAREQVLIICMDRAVLLAEVPHAILRQFAGEDATRLGQLVAAQRRAAEASEVDRDREDRYLPLGPHRCEFDTFGDWSNALRPNGWSWCEFIAAGGPSSAHQLCRAATEVFEENVVVEQSEAAWRGRDRPPISSSAIFVESQARPIWSKLSTWTDL